MSEDTKLEDIKGVGRMTAEKLRKAGVNSVEELAVTPIRELIAKAELSKKSASNLSETARRLMSMSFVSAMELWEMRKNMMRCSTGSEALDDMLAGGIETKAMTELVGQYSAGKTQICLKLCVMAQLPPEKGGLSGRALFFDTEGTFSAQRIHQIAQAMELDPESILDGILVSRVYTSDHQILLLDHSFKVCREEEIKLVIVDSLISHFRSEYIGRESLAERQQKLNNYLHKLLRLAEVYNLAVVVTNQAQANPNAFFGDPNRPAGGHVMAHACTHRVMLRKSKGAKRIARVFDSPYIPERECAFSISEKGIEDVEE
ncbi:MAG: DNA repair and recombination protein RadA [Candidatus Bathyarchaeia archaeon]